MIEDIESLREKLKKIEILIRVRYKSLIGIMAKTKIGFSLNLQYKTAATDGKSILFDPDFVRNSSEDVLFFVYCHELFHIKFKHMKRLKMGDIKRDFDTWNLATDGVINIQLDQDGYTIPNGFVNIEYANKYNAEELYDILASQNNNQNGSSAKNGNNENSDFNNDTNDNVNNDDNSQIVSDDHSFWNKEFDEKDIVYLDPNIEDTDINNGKQESEQKDNDNGDEKDFFENNRVVRKKETLEKYKKMREDMIRNMQPNQINIQDIGSANDSIDWKMLLKNYLDDEETIWSLRHSVAENNYAYRLEDWDEENIPDTEVMIDTSGSIDESLVKSFLRIVKSIVKSSKIKIGCFDTKFYGFQEVNNESDIDKLIFKGGGLTNLDLPVLSFTRKSDINKIIFTDGYPSYTMKPQNNLKNENIIWIVYGNNSFKPWCGKVITLSEKDLNKLNSLDSNTQKVL